MHAYPGFGAGRYSVIGLYKGPCVYGNGGVLLSDVTGSLKVIMCYRDFFQKGLSRVNFQLGAMQC